MWNPIDALRKKFGGEAPAASSAASPAMPDMKELEKKGMLGQFFRRWKDPAFLRQMKAVAARMQAEGVNIKDTKAVSAWVEKHKKELESGQFAAAPAVEAPKTFVKTGPEIGRNEPCPCGSGKKHKKCCGK